MPTMFNKVTIIGVGLIGGSLGMALLDRGLARSVVGVGRNAVNLRQAHALGAITEGTRDAVAGVRGAELVVLATPVGAIVPVLKHIAPHLAPGTLVTDVGSTKETIITQAEGVIPPTSSFVGGHPMAGAETAGVSNADRYLFEGAFWVICATSRTVPSAISRLRAMVERIGSRAIELGPAEHDYMIAAVSHLPHAVAAALVNTLAAMPGGEQSLSLAAGGFRDTTRIAASNPELWRDILLTNRASILEVLRTFRRQLGDVENSLREGHAQALVQWLATARDVRRAVPSKIKGYLYDLHDLVVTVPDRPGAIANTTTALSQVGLNICDIEILRVREGEAGTLRLAFASESDRDLALTTLKHAGIPARARVSSS